MTTHLEDECGAYRDFQLKNAELLPKVSKEAPIKAYYHKITKLQSTSLRLKAARAIYCNNKSFNEYDDDVTTAFIEELRPGFKPPNKAALTGKLLDEVYQEYLSKVKEVIQRSRYVNIIFDGSNNFAKRHVLNLSLQLPIGPALYWRTIDVGSMQLTANNHLIILLPMFMKLTNGDLKKINGVSTDTCETMKAVHRRIQYHPELSHVICVHYDSHGLQLLIKDILEMSP